VQFENGRKVKYSGKVMDKLGDIKFKELRLVEKTFARCEGCTPEYFKDFEKRVHDNFTKTILTLQYLQKHHRHEAVTVV
jgi:hypothetical protein